MEIGCCHKIKWVTMHFQLIDQPTGWDHSPQKVYWRFATGKPYDLPSQPLIQALDDASFKKFLIILQQAQCDGPTQIKVTRNLAAWSLNQRSQMFKRYCLDRCWIALGQGGHKHIEALKLPRTFHWICIWISYGYQFLTVPFGTI